ncbi:hypothetical protein QR680_007306 [Steinernema hermaphroditum]|uniref:Sodium/hydrogen exchanger n=1 Tax=Steinernema hermaphroditum TaxID=289476 RepID=A0AA39ICS2_9BILA|nr:hypothetical protein QR680_007306 [Steinernema hermaphroditum]
MLDILTFSSVLGESLRCKAQETTLNWNMRASRLLLLLCAVPLVNAAIKSNIVYQFPTDVSEAVSSSKSNSTTNTSNASTESSTEVKKQPAMEKTFQLDLNEGQISEVKSDDNGTLVINETALSAQSDVSQENQEKEKESSKAIFFILMVIVVATLLVHVLIITKFHYIPESLAIVILGASIGLALSYSKQDWKEVETFSPNFFFLVLLPPIIFESGYNLNKGNFFSNIIPILTFAIVGTAVSAFVIGFSLYVLGQMDVIYSLSPFESFAFGSMISAVDPVATLAIFQALKVDQQLYMLVFGESMLNDAVAIVLTSTALEMSDPTIAAQYTTYEAVQYSFGRFFSMFFTSAFLGSAVGFLSALLFKHVDLRKTPSLEFALLLVFAYLPYGLAEASSMSGIMAILFCAITMSQYTHFNISPITQITMKQTFRTMSFVAETCTFAYLGMALFTIKLIFQPIFLIVTILLLFVSRAVNIFPLSYLVNCCRTEQISVKNQVIMWFSGMRGAVAFALALHMELEDASTKRMLLTTTLFLLLFTIVFLGGSTLPVLKYLNDYFVDDKGTNGRVEGTGTPTGQRKRRRSKRQRSLSVKGRTVVPNRSASPLLLSKTQEMALTFDHSTEHFTESEAEYQRKRRTGGRNNIFTQINNCLVRPLFVRKFTTKEKMENQQKFRNFASEALKPPRFDDFSSSDELFSGTSFSQDSHPLLEMES